jgi:hypothetical protein
VDAIPIRWQGAILPVCVTITWLFQSRGCPLYWQSKSKPRRKEIARHEVPGTELRANSRGNRTRGQETVHYEEYEEANKAKGP